MVSTTFREDKGGIEMKILWREYDKLDEYDKKATKSWKGARLGDRVELRKVSSGDIGHANMWIVIAQYKDHPKRPAYRRRDTNPIKTDEDITITFSMNGTSQWTLEEFKEIGDVIEEAVNVFLSPPTHICPKTKKDTRNIKGYYAHQKKDICIDYDVYCNRCKKLPKTPPPPSNIS